MRPVYHSNHQHARAPTYLSSTRVVSEMATSRSGARSRAAEGDLVSRAMFLSNVRAAASNAARPGRLYVIITTGALCPVHYMHVQMLEDARTQLQVADPEGSVVAGYVSINQSVVTSYHDTIDSID